MSINRTAVWLLAWCAAMVLVGGRAMAQPANANLTYQPPTPSYSNASAPFSNDTPSFHGPALPLGPENVEPDFRLFAPAETSGYGNGPRPHIGWFCGYERVYWSLSKPKSAPIGDPNATNIQIPTLDPIGLMVDNDFIGAIGSWGNRWTVGYIDDNNYGYLCEVLDHVSQGQFRLAENVNLAFGDPNGLLHAMVPINLPGGGSVITDIGELPTVFLRLGMQNQLTLNGLELMRFYRAPRLHRGGFFELLYGARWFGITDSFTVQGVGNGLVQETASVGGFGADPTVFSFPLNILDASTFNTRIINNIVGPQIGARFFHQRGHWTTSFEARFLAGVNFQNAMQTTNLGTAQLPDSVGAVISQALLNVNLRTNFVGIGTNTHQYSTTFSPVGEIRLNASYQVTSNVGIKIGYTGLVAGGISRASTRINYDSPNLIGILPTGIHDTFFLNGLNFGVEINR